MLHAGGAPSRSVCTSRQARARRQAMVARVADWAPNSYEVGKTRKQIFAGDGAVVGVSGRDPVAAICGYRSALLERLLKGGKDHDGRDGRDGLTPTQWERRDCRTRTSATATKGALSTGTRAFTALTLRSFKSWRRMREIDPKLKLLSSVRRSRSSVDSCFVRAKRQ